MEKRVIAASVHPLVRGLRPSATSSTMDDRRPADRRLCYHTTRAVANFFSRPTSRYPIQQSNALFDSDPTPNSAK